MIRLLYCVAHRRLHGHETAACLPASTMVLDDVAEDDLAAEASSQAANGDS